MRSFLKKNLMLFLSLATAIIIVSGCDEGDAKTIPPEATTVIANPFPDPPELPLACEYTVLGERGLGIGDYDRSVGRWLIISENATSFEERVQTVVQATIDLYRRYERDFTAVSLAAAEDTEMLPYASAFFAADGLGPAGMTGSAAANPGFWRVTAVSHTLSEQELAISKLWWDNIERFPNPNPISSYSYDKEALRQYIAEKLGIDYEETIMPDVTLEEYVLAPQMTEWSAQVRDYHREIEPAAVFVTPQPGHRLEDEKGANCGVIIGNARAEAGISDHAYSLPIWSSALGLKEGDPCIIVSGTITNLDPDKPVIALWAQGYDAEGFKVTESLDSRPISITLNPHPEDTITKAAVVDPTAREQGKLCLHLDGNESGEFTLHLLPSEELAEIRIFGTVNESP